MGFALHLEHAKSTEFCVSCHVMEPYGTSLHFDDLDYLPASHFQNNLVPREKACYTCHTQYTMFGDVRRQARRPEARLGLLHRARRRNRSSCTSPTKTGNVSTAMAESRSFVGG